ncbi:MAG: hypothetical protein O2897_04090 [bacterium]|nr:hypothetical protein [bacterium]
MPNYLWCVALHNGLDDEICDDLLTSASSKGYGLSLETWQKNDSSYNILIAWLAGFAGVKLFQNLDKQNLNIVSSIVLATSTNLLAKSHKNYDEEEFHQDKIRIAYIIEFWILKSANLGTRLALEKKLVNLMFSDELKASCSKFMGLFFTNIMSKRQYRDLNNIIFSAPARIAGTSLVFIGTELVLAKDNIFQTDWSSDLTQVVLLNFIQGAVIPLAIVFMTPITAFAVLLGYRWC